MITNPVDKKTAPLPVKRAGVTSAVKLEIRLHKGQYSLFFNGKRLTKTRINSFSFSTLTEIILAASVEIAKKQDVIPLENGSLAFYVEEPKSSKTIRAQCSQLSSRLYATMEDLTSRDLEKMIDYLYNERIKTKPLAKSIGKRCFIDALAQKTETLLPLLELRQESLVAAQQRMRRSPYIHLIKLDRMPASTLDIRDHLGQRDEENEFGLMVDATYGCFLQLGTDPCVKEGSAASFFKTAVADIHTHSVDVPFSVQDLFASSISFLYKYDEEEGCYRLKADADKRHTVVDVLRVPSGIFVHEAKGMEVGDLEAENDLLYEPCTVKVTAETGETKRERFSEYSSDTGLGVGKFIYDHMQAGCQQVELIFATGDTIKFYSWAYLEKIAGTTPKEDGFLGELGYRVAELKSQYGLPYSRSEAALRANLNL